jgi:Conserved in the green lineage and diatoms 27
MTCPVPEEQQPLNEYLELRQSFFFRWATLGIWQYLRVLAGIWLAWWIFSGPIAASSYAPQRNLVMFLLLGSLGATIGSLLPLLQLFLGWKYVSDRLQSSKIFYEESGWYDGQTWQKPEADLAKERLIVSYELQPLLHKIQWTGLSLILLLSLLIAWAYLQSAF